MKYTNLLISFITGLLYIPVLIGYLIDAGGKIDTVSLEQMIFLLIIVFVSLFFAARSLFKKESIIGPLIIMLLDFFLAIFSIVMHSGVYS